MRMLGSSMTAATFYSFSGDAVEALGLDGEECEMPDDDTRTLGFIIVYASRFPPTLLEVG